MFENLTEEEKKELESKNERIKYLEGEKDTLVTQRQTLKKEIEELKNHQSTLTEAEKTKLGELEKSLVDTKNNLAEKETEINQLKIKASEWDEYNNAKREAIKNKLGERYLSSYDGMKLSDLEKTAEFILQKETPDTDGGGGFSREIPLTEAQKKDAAEKGLSEETYREFLRTRKKIEEGRGQKKPAYLP